MFHFHAQNLFQLEEEEEEEDKFDIFVSVKDPEKIGEAFIVFVLLNVACLMFKDQFTE